MFRKSLKTILSVFIVSFLLCAVCFAQSGNDILKIGLLYGTDALPAVNLQNVTGYGSGYSIGYFDSNRQFVSLYNISETKITMVKDKLIYLNGTSYYDTLPASYTDVIKPYHIELSASYSSASEAESVKNRISSQGIEAFVAYSGGSYKVRCGAYGTESEASSDLSRIAGAAGITGKVVGYSSTCYTVTVTGSSEILFEFDNGQPMGIMPKSAGGETRTWFKGYQYLGGFEYNRVNGNDITVIGVLSMDDYIKGVVPYEMSASWNIEALKAQALCAKSYAVNSMGKHGSSGFDLCNSTHCQVYKGMNSATANSNAAVEAVSGQYILYNGKVAEGYYHASSGGHTEDVENIWGTYVPYLRGVDDPYLKYAAAADENWTYSITLDEIESILKSKGYSVTELTDFYVSKYSQYGNAIEITYVDKYKGKSVIKGETVRTVLNTGSKTIVKSHRFTISQQGGLYVGNREVSSSTGTLYTIGAGGKQVLSGNISDKKAITANGVENISVSSGNSSEFIIKGSGAGHNIGMSQRGAKGMADNGFTYDAIIKHFFTGVTIGNVD